MEGPSYRDLHTVTIIVKQIGPRNATVFNRILERLSRQSAIQVSENPRRVFHAQFLPAVPADIVKFGELHLCHRVFGFVGVACGGGITTAESAAENAYASSLPGGSRDSCESSARNGPTTNENGCKLPLDRKISSGPLTMEDVRKNYDKIKTQFSSTLVDSRCILIGYDEDSVAEMPSREILSFSGLEQSNNLEVGIRDLLRAIYFVLESKRLDMSFEKVEPTPCPLIPEEEKFRIGVENKSSKTYKKKCLGRCRKHNADYAMLTGLPQLALDAYAVATEQLKVANDYLWLAGACEGWACAAMRVQFEVEEPVVVGIPRVASLLPHQLKEAQMESQQQNQSQHMLGVMMGHMRHRSDENQKVSNGFSNGEVVEKRRTRILPWNRDRTKDRIDSALILERFELALEHYGRYSLAALLEYQCMMRTLALFRYQRNYINMETFHREHVGKYLDDSFALFDHHMKAFICHNSSMLYKQIGWERKSSFFARLGVLFKLHISDGEQRSVADYRTVYPILFRTLVGYGIVDDSRDQQRNCLGPVTLQIKALHEVYTAASRAELPDASIRHLVHLLQVYYDDLDASMASRLFDDLANLVRLKGSAPVLNQRISVGFGNIILPPIQMSRFPQITHADLRPLPSHLAPTVVSQADVQPDIFIYSPFQIKKLDTKPLWVVHCACEVWIHVYNCLPVELVVRELRLVVEGCDFDPIPMRLVLPAATTDATHTSPAATPIKLIGIPKKAGILNVTGYSCEVFGLRNVCKLESKTSLQVEVLPPLAQVLLDCSLPRAPIEEHDDQQVSETTVFSGQLQTHWLTLINDSDLRVSKLRLHIWQPKVCGGPFLLCFVSEEDNTVEKGCEREFHLTSREERRIPFRIFGIDPTATADDNEQEKIVEMSEPLAPVTDTGALDLIPYTGRLLTAHFVCTYQCQTADMQIYERQSRLPLAITVVPCVTVSAWHVLPGDGPFSRYIVVDVNNSTEHDAELVYSGNRRMNVLPRETCRVPLLCPCCSDVAGRSFHTATQKDSHLMQKMEVEKLRQTLEAHVAKHLDIRWAIPATETTGVVPMGALLSSVSLLKQLVLPAISLDISVNGVPYVSEDDVSVGIGEVVLIQIAIISSLDYDLEGVLSMECYQEISQQFGTVDKSENLMILGARRLPFYVQSKQESESSRCTVSVRVLFRGEGQHRLRPLIVSRQEKQYLLPDEIFVSPIGFSVCTRNHH